MIWSTSVGSRTLRNNSKWDKVKEIENCTPTGHTFFCLTDNGNFGFVKKTWRESI